MRSIIKDKRGDLTQLFVFMIVAFVLSVAVVIMYFVATTTYDNLMDKGAPAIQKALGDSENATEIIDSTYGKVPNSYQALKWITTMLIVGMVFSILITSFLVRVNPVWFVAYLFLWIIAIIVSVPISNTYEQIYLNPTLASSFAGFWGQTYIFLNLPIWIGVIGAIAGIVMFVNMVKQSQYGGYY